MTRPLRTASVLFAALALLSLAAPALGSPQPINVCGACGEAFEDAADGQGVSVTVSRSAATVQIHRNGSATWTVTNRINASAADRLADEPETVDRIGRAAAREGYGLPHENRAPDATFQRAVLDGRNVTVRFRSTGAAERHFGTLVVDLLHSDGVRGGWIVNADRFTIGGPPGTAVVNEPRSGVDRDPVAVPTVEGRNATWNGTGTGRYENTFREDVYVAYGPPSASDVRVDAALALATSSIWIGNVGTFVVPAVAVYAVLLVVIAVFVRRIGSGDTDRLGAAVAGIGAIGLLAAGAAVLLDETSWFAGVAVVYLTIGIAAWRRPASVRSLRGAAAIAVASVAAAGLALFGLAVLGGPDGQSIVRALKLGAYHLPVAVAPVAGLLLGQRGGRRRYGPTAGGFCVALGSLTVALLASVPVATRPSGLLAAVTVGGAVVAALVAIPLLALGVRAAGSHDAESVTARTADHSR